MVLASWVIILDVYIATGSFCFLVVLYIFFWFSGNSLQHSGTVKIG